MSAMSVPGTARPAARRSPFWTLTRSEARLLARSPGHLFFIAVLPVAAEIVLAVWPATRRPVGGDSVLAGYLPILMMFSLLQAGVVMLSSVLALYRERGILRRLALTPVPPARLLFAEAALYLAVGVAVDLILLGVGLAGGVRASIQPASAALSLLLVAASMLGIGMLVTALAPREQVAQAVSTILLFPLMFFAGLWIPRAEMSSTLLAISNYTPLGAGVEALQAAGAGRWPEVSALLVMAGYAAVCGFLAARLFRWDWD